MSKLNILAAAALGLAVTACSCSYMEKRVESPVYKEGEFLFRYPSHSARTVQLAGDWNNWGKGDAGQGEVLVGLMDKDEKGIWNLAAQLPPGRYRYWFIINETQRVLDPANPRVADDPWGGKASLLIVP